MCLTFIHQTLLGCPIQALSRFTISLHTIKEAVFGAGGEPVRGVRRDVVGARGGGRCAAAGAGQRAAARRAAGLRARLGARPCRKALHTTDT